MSTELGERLSATLGATYTLERELAGAGMSRVFVAYDARLGRRVAVKVLHPDRAAGLSAHRFEREIRLAARLQHPHIVPLLSAGDLDGLPYYTMPFVEGESLAERLRRDGALPVRETVRLLRELADALAYAHAEGIVHRDLKPGNVLLSRGHAMVADFGVGKALTAATEGAAAGGAASTATTGLGVAVGTPAYMAPEQVTGDPATDHRADLYALGVIGYELLAGGHPFADRSPPAMLAAQLIEAPPPLAARRTDAPPALVELVTDLLAKQPEERPQRAEDVVAVLDALTTSPVGSTRSARGRRTRVAAAVLGGAMVLAGAGALARARRTDAPRLRSTARTQQVASAGVVARRVAVAPLANQTGDSALGTLGDLASDWITQGLAEAGFAEVVDPGTIRSTWRSAPDALALARSTGARLVVSGAYYVQGDTLRLLARISDAARGNVLRALEPVSAPVAAPREVVARLRDRVLGALAGLLDASPDTWAVVSELPPSLAAYRHFTAGLESFNRYEFPAATREFLAAHRVDSSFVQPIIWAGIAQNLAGAPATADTLFRLADRARDRLAPADRYLLDALWAEARGDFAGSLRAARELARVAPASASARLLVGWQGTRVNRPLEAVAALRLIDRERVRGYAGYWEVLTQGYHLLGDYSAELAEAGRGRRAFPDRLTAVYNEARALAALGRVGDVERCLDELVDLPEDPGYRPVEVIEAVGGELRTHGHAAAAAAAFARALRWYEARPAAERETPTFRARYAEALYLVGRFQEAGRIVEPLLPLPSSRWERAGFLGVLPGTPTDDVTRRGYVGTAAARRGDRAAALAADRALAAVRRPYLFGRTTYWRARIAAQLGDGERAVMLLRQALQEGQTYPTLHGDVDLSPLHDLPAFQLLVQPKG